MNITNAKILWVNSPAREIDQYVAFRKEFEATENGTFTLSLFANTYYNLYVDGEFIHRGPVRRHEAAAQYDTVPFDLKKGKHVIAVLVHWIGMEHAGHRKGMAAFWCVGEGAGCTLTSDSDWKARYMDAFTTDGSMFGHYDFREDVDMRRFDRTWNTLGYDDGAWENAAVLGAPGTDADVHKNYTKRTMRNFSYILNEAEFLSCGRYTEAENAAECASFYDRFLNRIRSADGADGSFVVAGLDATQSGTAIVEYADVAEGDELLLAYDDRFDDGECALPVYGKIFNYGDRFVLPAGSGKIEVFFPRGFRYVWADLSGKGKITKITARREVYPYLPKSIGTSSAFLDNLYKQSIRTQHVCTIDGYTDCVNRERVLWLGDAWIDTMSAYFYEADKGLLLTTMYEHALGRNDKTGILGGYNSSDLRPDWLYMISYNLMYLHMLCDYIRYTDHEEDILPLKDVARSIISHVRKGFNENGIYDSNTQGCGSFWDWGNADVGGQVLKTAAFYIYTLEQMSRFDFFKDIVADQNMDLDELRQKTFKVFWDDERRVFHDGCELGKEWSPICTQLANALAVLAGICPPELKDELLERIVDPAELDQIAYGEVCNEQNFDKILPAATMFSGMMVTMAMFEAGRFDLAMAYMKDVWGPFADLPTLPELRRNGLNNTMCHGWSGGAGYLIPRYLVGVTPIENGWKSAELTPAAEVLSHAEARIPTPLGDLTVQWYRMGDVLKVSAILPATVTLTIHWAGRDTVLRESGEIVIMP